MNLYEKLLAARQEIGYLQKDGKVEFGSTKYKAITDEKVMTTVRPILDKYKIVMLIDSIQMSRAATLTEAVITWRFVDVENPKDFILVQSAGQGADTQDKGAGKAMTYSRKYALLNTLLIPTGEDPDKISSDELTERFKEEQGNSELVAARSKVVQLAELKAEDGPKLVADKSVELFNASFVKLTIDQLRTLFTEIKGMPNV